MISARGSELEDQDGLNEAGNPGRWTVEFMEEAPRLEGGDGLLDLCADLCVGAVGGLLTSEEDVPSAAAGETVRVARALVTPGLPVS
ncbi:hypothetical protein GCM10011578_085060 [Streptomyces fuscichromogenes]|uniref:Uncharacterized protein n=1 Tax=Streptomyces fuscichromogenes TaxID=1324013 RepID=A0A917XMC8_9ACTN|nr:hypothetical protein GCM10011578_085060 [Streptomyces fuscichromogenes]